jgi:hypothetical protein
LDLWILDRRNLDLRNLHRGVLCYCDVFVCNLCREGVINSVHVLI